MKEYNTRQEGRPHRCFFLFVYFYCFVSLRSEQPAATDIKTAGKDASLTVQGTGLNLCLELLEVIASLPVPEMHASIVPYMSRGREGEGRVSMGRVYTARNQYLQTQGHCQS